MDPILHLLSWVQLLALAATTFFIDSQFSGKEFSLVHHPQISRAGGFINKFKLDQSSAVSGPTFVLKDLQPCTAFTNLRRLDIGTKCKVDLNDDGLLALASMWPCLFINRYTGWKTEGGITPSGFIRLLHACPSLSAAALAIDARDYAHFPPRPMITGPTLYVVDSVIKAEAIPAVTDFFAGIALHDLSECTSRWMGRPGGKTYHEHWNDVFFDAYFHRLVLQCESREPLFSDRR